MLDWQLASCRCCRCCRLLPSLVLDLGLSLPRWCWFCWCYGMARGLIRRCCSALGLLDGRNGTSNSVAPSHLRAGRSFTEIVAILY
jgi:hypothetical protein